MQIHMFPAVQGVRLQRGSKGWLRPRNEVRRLRHLPAESEHPERKETGVKKTPQFFMKVFPPPRIYLFHPTRTSQSKTIHKFLTILLRLGRNSVGYCRNMFT